MNGTMRSMAAIGLWTLLNVTAHPGEAPTSYPPEVAGTWQGTLTAGGTNLRVVLSVTQPSAGQIAGTLDLPAAGANALPLEHVGYADGILSFDVNLGAPSRYEGVVSRDAMELVGHLQQGGNIIPLTLTHTDATPDTNAARPAILANPRRTLALQPCGVAGVTRDALCAQYEVYENRAQPAGRQIRLNVMVLPDRVLRRLSPRAC